MSSFVNYASHTNTQTHYQQKYVEQHEAPNGGAECDLYEQCGIKGILQLCCTFQGGTV